MSKKNQQSYICQQCGSVFTKWAGKCDGCGEWNSLVLESTGPVESSKLSYKKSKHLEFVDLKSQDPTDLNLKRLKTHINEFDRVCGGGLVKGSVLLIGGDPGIGKSTILLQTVCALSSQGINCAYISGEEGIEQIRLRAQRLNLENAPVQLTASSNVKDIIYSLNEIKKDRQNQKPYQVVVIDSIQTMFLDEIDSAPGTVSQVRGCAHELIRFAKNNDIILFIVGHVTKEGTLAGPRVLEHMVDTVLYFEGDRGHQFRIMRSVKNRFGPTDEIGVFEMRDKGLAEVPNPSELFLTNRQEDISGTVVFAGIEGTRPVLVEIQALVAQSVLATPRRAVVGWDMGRLSMIVAVLETKCGIQIAQNDIYLNIAGGLRINEPAADLAVACALLSALTGQPIPKHTAIFGEIGLTGEIRPASQISLRIKESSKLGYRNLYTCLPHQKFVDQETSDYQIKSFDRLQEILGLFEDTSYNQPERKNFPRLIKKQS